MWNESFSTAEAVPVETFFYGPSQSSVDLVHAAGVTWIPPLCRARCWTSLPKRFRLLTERRDEALSGETTQNLALSLTAPAGPEPLLVCWVNKEFTSAAYEPPTSKQSTNQPGRCRYHSVSLCDWDGSTTGYVLQFAFELVKLVLYYWESEKKEKNMSKKIFGLMIIQLYPQARPVF